MEASAPKNSHKLHVSLDYKWLTVALVGVILVMLLLWKPWVGAADDTQTVQVNGEATVKAVPDEFVFYPTYEITNKQPQAAMDTLAAKSDKIVAKLKKLGVPETGIKTTANNYKYYDGMPEQKSYNLQITITIGDDKLAQKVQDYLITTEPSGNFTPQASFSDSKRKELERQARDEPTKDARKKAEQMGENLGFKVGGVKAVTDSSGFGVFPYAERGSLDMDGSTSSKGLDLNPGENELQYTVTVTYYIR